MSTALQTESRGWGLIAKEDISEGSLIIEYCGEMINDEECTRRLNETEVTGKKDYYFFKLGNDLVSSTDKNARDGGGRGMRVRYE